MERIALPINAAMYVTFLFEVRSDFMMDDTQIKVYERFDADQFAVIIDVIGMWRKFGFFLSV
ncbi:hypothetical protein RJP21_10685 [Paenibacillus sp. VCA1]|uniref:hypothetical protein n=1 Tax=Paenibacillus sp. VCA1 TaxID=3039148 RepID=UPI002871C843|nr:hypothetical protein [Paenibacillus sp. VCA1]MDR9854065.1 hypothetical protein [Paenibacillus sp. VCA1]